MHLTRVHELHNDSAHYCGGLRDHVSVLFRSPDCGSAVTPARLTAQALKLLHYSELKSIANTPNDRKERETQ